MRVFGKNAQIFIDPRPMRDGTAVIDFRRLMRTVERQKISNSLLDEALWALERALAHDYVLAGLPEDDEALYE